MIDDKMHDAESDGFNVGGVSGTPVDWRADVDDDVDVDDSDDEMDETPPDVVELLGFDPKEFSDVN